MGGAKGAPEHWLDDLVAEVRTQERARVAALLAAAHDLDEELYRSINNSRIPARVRNAHIAMAAALAALDAGDGA